MNTAKQTQAETSRLFRALTELANSEDSESVKRFIARWPGFLATEHALQMFVRPEQALTEWGLKARNKLRAVWRKGTDADYVLSDLLFSSLDCEETDGIPTRPLTAEHFVSADLSRGRLSYTPDTDLQRACYLLLQNADRIKVCANPDCPAPYFVAHKAIQRYCSPDCLKLAQREWSRDWWNRVGKFERARRKKSKASPKKGR